MKLLIKQIHIAVIILILPFMLLSCYYPYDRYNTQAGATIGAGTGALIGQAIGGNTEGTLIGMAAGTILGALVGNAVDQDYQAARDAAMYGKPVIYYDQNGHAVEATPQGTNNPNCQKVQKRVWENGKLVKETIEEVCASPAQVVRYYPVPHPYYHGAPGWPFVPHLYFNYGRPYSHYYYRHRTYPYKGGRHHY